jgi:DNA transposition AAA+ family ATPase
MAISKAERRELLKRDLPQDAKVREMARAYMARSGLSLASFSERLGYARSTLNNYMNCRYHEVSGNSGPIRAALVDFMQTNPIATADFVGGTLFETANVKLFRNCFNEVVERGRCGVLVGDPGKQKSYVAEHLIARLNQRELPKNGSGMRAVYVYCPSPCTPQQLMREIARAAGVSPRGDVRTIVHELRFHLRGRKVAFILDEAQHLDDGALEAARELHDRPPHAGILFLGSHNFDERLRVRGLHLEQWRSRLHFKKLLPGIQKEEAAAIIRAWLGPKATREVIAEITAGCTVLSLPRPKKPAEQYISARSLFNALRTMLPDPAERELEGATA